MKNEILDKVSKEITTISSKINDMESDFYDLKLIAMRNNDDFDFNVSNLGLELKLIRIELENITGKLSLLNKFSMQKITSKLDEGYQFGIEEGE